MELAAGHAPQTILLKSLCWTHVSAAVQASEPGLGSAPAQQRVGMGSVVTVLFFLGGAKLQGHRFLGVHGMLCSMESMTMFTHM
jgi:hypothetical protein